MQAHIGDRVHVHSYSGSVQWGEVLDVRGSDGQPPYLVAFDDGYQGLIFPSPDAVVEHTELTSDPAGHPSTR
ncbi:MAG TPA: DUF1918 domain-containing protein [Cryptosporangiaceae bacterium]|nr:DUF1918 domain-containing protein [Cryptosporangiaceae bacterium]